MLYTPPPSPRLTTCLAPEDRLGMILAGRLELTRIIGHGAFGVVYEAIHVATKVRYAVKALPKFGLDARQRKAQSREIALHYRASHHPNVLHMERILESADCTYVVLEYCPEGDLFANITEYGRFVGEDRLVKHVFLQVLDAVRYCHSIGIYHRDLKPENVLVTNKGQTVKLADFGLATTDQISTDYGCGSTFYMSPECGQSRPYASYATAPNDVWSLGVMLVNLTCGRNPWKKASPEDSTFRAFLKDPTFLSTILPITPELNHILRRIFECDPRRRIGLNELEALILACPSLTTINEDVLPSPPHTPAEYVDVVDAMDCAAATLPSPPPHFHGSRLACPPPSSDWSFYAPAVKQNSNYSTTSSDSGYESDASFPEIGHCQPFNFYGNVLPFQDAGKAPFYNTQQPFVTTQIAAF